MIMGKIDFIPGAKSKQESQSKLLQQAKSIVNDTNIPVNKYNY